MDLSYEELHWGETPGSIEILRWPSGVAARIKTERNGTPIEIIAASYTTRKSGEPETVYRHEFERHDGRLPYLLSVPGSNPRNARTWRLGNEAVALGRLLDIETSDGARILTPFFWIVTSPSTGRNGGPVIFASRFNPHIAIEHRLIGTQLCPHITPHGIEG